MKPSTTSKLLLAWLVAEILLWPVGFYSRPYHAIGGETVRLIAAAYAYISYRLYLRLED